MLCAFLIASLVTAGLAAPSPRPQQAAGYNLASPPNAVSLHGGARDLQGGFTVRLHEDSLEQFASLESGFPVGIQTVCPKGQLRHGLRCVVPKINRNIFVFGKGEDSKEGKSVDYANVPLPELEYNIIFVRPSSAKKPVVVPPPQKKTVVYVLEDEPTLSDEILETPSYPTVDPEVYYVKVKPGENPQLPGGIDLHSAYNQALQDNSNDLLNSVEHTLGSHLSHGGAAGVQGAGLGAFAGGLSLESLAQQAAISGGAGVALPSIGAAGAAGTPIPQTHATGSVGVALPSFSSTSSGAPAPSFNFANLNNVGVPLPSLGGTQKSNQNRAGHALHQPLDNSRQQGLAANLANSEVLINMMRKSLAAQGLEIDFDNGVPTIEPASAEVGVPGRTYLTPN